MKVLFDDKAWNDYQEWLELDRKKLLRINKLIEECLRTPFTGSGKPEALRHQLQGFWSRRIDMEHRLIYSSENEVLTIVSCRHHYK